MVTVRKERPAEAAAREALLDLAYGPDRFTKASERLREGRLPELALIPCGAAAHQAVLPDSQQRVFDMQIAKAGRAEIGRGINRRELFRRPPSLQEAQNIVQVPGAGLFDSQVRLADFTLRQIEVNRGR